VEDPNATSDTMTDDRLAEKSRRKGWRRGEARWLIFQSSIHLPPSGLLGDVRPSKAKRKYGAGR